MTPEQKAAFIQAQTACMLAELEGMKLANAERLRNRDAPVYCEQDFYNLPVRFGLTHNQVISFFL